MFGKARRCEREGCDIGAIETGQQVFTPSDGCLKKASVVTVRKCRERGRKKRDIYHSKEYIGENTQ